jgi:serine/threonine-protein kinase SRPK3
VADVWTLACTVFELFGSRSLFMTIWGDLNEVIVDIVAVLGRLPEQRWRVWGSVTNWYTEEGELKDDGGRELTLEEGVRTARRTRKDVECLVESDREALVGILRATLKLEPKERATAAELLPVEWEKGESWE